MDALQGLCQPEGRRRHAGVQPGADGYRLRSPAAGTVRLLLQNLTPAPGEGSGTQDGAVQTSPEGRGLGHGHVPGPLHSVPHHEEHKDSLVGAVAGSGGMHKGVHQKSVHPDAAAGFPAQRHQPRVLLPHGRQIPRASPRQAEEAVRKVTAARRVGRRELGNKSSVHHFQHCFLRLRFWLCILTHPRWSAAAAALNPPPDERRNIP